MVAVAVNEGGEVEQAGALVRTQGRSKEDAAGFLKMAGGLLLEVGYDCGDGGAVAQAGDEFSRVVPHEAGAQGGGVKSAQGVVVAFEEEGFYASAQVVGELGGASGEQADFVQVVFNLKGEAERAGEIVQAEEDGLGRAREDGTDEERGFKSVARSFEVVGIENVALGNLVERAVEEGEFECFAETGILCDGGEIA